MTYNQTNQKHLLPDIGLLDLPDITGHGKTQTTRLNHPQWLETVAPELNIFVTSTIEKWNTKANQMNQWSELGWDERDALLAMEAANA